MLKREIQLKNGQVCILSQAKEEDAKNILDYMKCVCGETNFLSFGRGDINWTVEKERNFIKDHIDTDNKLLVIAEIQGQLVGITGFTGDEKTRLRHTGELGIVVLRKYWGHGLGSTLIECMIEWAKTTGVVRKINLRVRVDNQRALRLYEHFGFVKEGLVSRQFSVDGKFYDAYLMGLKIDPYNNQKSSENEVIQ